MPKILGWLTVRRDGTLVIRSPRGARSWPIGRTSASEETVRAVLVAASATSIPPEPTHARATWVREALAAAGIHVPEPTANDGSLLSPAAVAERRGVSLSQVKAAISRGDLRATIVRGPGGAPSTYGVRPEDADAWVTRGVGRPMGD